MDKMEQMASEAITRQEDTNKALKVSCKAVCKENNCLPRWSVVLKIANQMTDTDTMTEETPQQNRAEYHYEQFMRSIGLDPSESEHMKETPRRVTEAFRDDLFDGLDEDPKRHLETTFEETASGENQEGIVIVDNIQIQSMCAHHFLPFTGVAHIGYVPRDEVVGLSKFARMTRGYARRPQVQERLTNQIADAINDVLEPRAVFVTVIADHQCMTCRGVKEPYSSTRTSAIRGPVADELEHKFYDMLNLEAR